MLFKNYWFFTSILKDFVFGCLTELLFDRFAKASIWRTVEGLFGVQIAVFLIFAGHFKLLFIDRPSEIWICLELPDFKKMNSWHEVWNHIHFKIKIWILIFKMKNLICCVIKVPNQVLKQDICNDVLALKFIALATRIQKVYMQ